MNTNNAGGGEILSYWGQVNNDGTSYLDTSVIKQFILLPFGKLAIALLLIALAFLIILKIFQVRSVFKGKALTSELEYLDRVKKRDESIVRANSILNTLTKLVEHSPLQLNKSYVEYWNYNLSRANIRVPGGFRLLRAEELNALIVVAELAVSCLGLFLGIFMNLGVGAMLIVITFSLGASLPMQYIRGIVKEKDNEIIANFADFYLMLHYVLLASAGTPIEGIMKSYDKTTNSKEMHRFVDVCVHYIDTYGEYEATRYIAKQYREVPEINKLMRLIRQANEGGDVRAELMGFRDELLAAKKYAIERRMDKLVGKARASFQLLTPVLVQAVISAMAIYLEDIGSAGSFL